MERLIPFLNFFRFIALGFSIGIAFGHLGKKGAWISFSIFAVLTLIVWGHVVAFKY